MDLELHQLDLRHADLRVHDPDRQRRLYASLAEVGQQVPIVVIADHERYLLVDGYLRVAALRRLGRDTAAAMTWALSETDALIQRRHFESATSRPALEDAWVLTYLHKTHGISLEELARRFCRSKSWVWRRLALVGQLSEAIQGRVRAGIVPPQAAMKYLVPLSRANRRHCDGLVAALGNGRVSVRDMAQLYMGYRRADAQGRERLCADPALYLRAVQASTAGVDEPSTSLAKDLSLLSAIAWRAHKRIGQGALGTEATYGRSHLVGSWRAVQASFAALTRAMKDLKEAEADAGPEHPSEHSQAC